MDEEPVASDEVFVVRYWRAGTAWRACVDHVPTKQRCYFVRLADLADFITQCLGRDGRFPDGPSVSSLT